MLFETNASLLPTDTDGEEDVYERSSDGALRNISDASDGLDPSIAARLSEASSDGTRVMVATLEALLPSDTDTAQDVYERGADGSLVHVTDIPTGPDADVDAFAFPARVGDRAVITTRERLAPSDTDAAYDVYVRRPGRPLLHVSDSPAGVDDELDSRNPEASRDGTRVFFATKERLAPTDTDTAQDVYERTTDGPLLHVSDNPSGPDANVDAQIEELSGGGTVAFLETDESLAPADTDTVQDVYRRDADAGPACPARRRGRCERRRERPPTQPGTLRGAARDDRRHQRARRAARYAPR